MPEPSEKARTCAYTLYPEDVAVIEAVAAEQFRYNTSEAARHIIRFYREAQSQDHTAPTPQARHDRAV